MLSEQQSVVSGTMDAKCCASGELAWWGAIHAHVWRVVLCFGAALLVWVWIGVIE